MTFSSAAPAGRMPIRAVAAVLATKLRRVSFISSSLCCRLQGPPPAAAVSPPGRAERPDQKVIAHIVVDFGEAQRLDDQERYDKRAVEHQRQVSPQIRAERDPKSSGSKPDKVVEDDRREQYQARAEEAAKHAAQPADDHHGENLDRQVDMKLVGRNTAQVANDQNRSDHAANERARPERQQLVFEGVDADNLGGVVLFTYRRERAPESRAPDIEHE